MDTTHDDNFGPCKPPDNSNQIPDTSINFIKASTLLPELAVTLMVAGIFYLILEVTSRKMFNLS